MEINMRNDALKHQGRYQGVYERKEIVNGKPSWNNSVHAIWYIPKRNVFVVGNLSDLGHNDTDMHNTGPSDGLKIRGHFMYASGLGRLADIHNVWNYWNGSKWNSPIYSNDLIVSCKGS